MSESKIEKEKEIAKEKERDNIQNNFTNEHKEIIDMSFDGRVYLYKYTSELVGDGSSTIYVSGYSGVTNKYITWKNGIGTLVEKNDAYPFEGFGEIVNAIFSFDNKVFLECKTWPSENAIFYCDSEGQVHYISRGSLMCALSKDLIMIKTIESLKDEGEHEFRKVIDYRGKIIFTELLE